VKQTNGADPSAYLPRWRALLLARVRLGEDAKLWRDGPGYCVGVVARRIAPGRTEVRLCGEGLTWWEAVSSIPPVKRRHQ